MNHFSKPIFFPDATKGYIRSIDFVDLSTTGIKGILVNTYHLYKDLGIEYFRKIGGIKKFLNYDGLVISDSGGFQIGSLLKMYSGKGHISNNGVLFKPDGEKQIMLTPEKSIQFQMALKTDLMVVLDDFTDPKATYEQAKVSVDRTLKWAYRSKKEFEKLLLQNNGYKNTRPLLIGVVQGGKYQDLRAYCAQELVKIGFDGLGYGGWPIDENGNFDLVSAKTIADNCPKNYLLYGLGIGKPKDIVSLSKLRFSIFDCVLPTRDARHGRAYVSINKTINLKNGKSKVDDDPIDKKCKCTTCIRYSKRYINYLFKNKDFTAGRLVTIHNLYFYAKLIESLY